MKPSSLTRDLLYLLAIRRRILFHLRSFRSSVTHARRGRALFFLREARELRDHLKVMTGLWRKRCLRAF